MHVEIKRVNWPYASAFRIASAAWTQAETVQIRLREGNLVGRGEGLPVFYHGETVDSMVASLEHLRLELTKGVSRSDLSGLLPPGGARNAVDCALWDLEAKRTGRRAWELAGIAGVKPLNTAYTLSVDTPDAMGRAAAVAARYSILKLKLTGEGDVERVAAVRTARQDADLIVDANQSWNEAQLYTFPAELEKLGVKLIEQPLPAAKDEALLNCKSPIPFCADESCQTAASLPAILGKYQFANIKLDKAGGLTEALRLARAAQSAGLKLMVGCMAGSSLSMAPGFIVGQLCAVVDLDGPLLAAKDIVHGIRYEGSQMYPPEADLWG